MKEDIGPDAIALSVLIERTHGADHPPPMSRDQVTLIVETLRKAGEEILRLRAS